MDYKQVIKTLQEYFEMRHKIKNEIFNGFTYINMYNLTPRERKLYIYPLNNFENFFLISKQTNTFIYFINQLGIKIFKEFISNTKKENNYIIVYKKITSDCIKYLKNVDNIVLFDYDKLQINIFKNDIMKKSKITKILNEVEKNEFKKQYNILNFDEIPKEEIHINLIYLNIKKNDIIEYIRDDIVFYKKII